MCNIHGMLIETGNRPTSRKTCPNTIFFHHKSYKGDETRCGWDWFSD